MNYEQVSALFDDELSDNEKELALDELMEDEQAQAFWQRMLIMRKSIRNELCDQQEILTNIRKELGKVASIQESKK